VALLKNLGEGALKALKRLDVMKQTASRARAVLLGVGTLVRLH
jgi:hypothetical protein